MQNQKNSVLDLQQLSSPKFPKTQFLAKNPVPNLSKTKFFRKFLPNIMKKCLKNPKFSETQYQKSKNSLPKSLKFSFPEIHDLQMAWKVHKKALIHSGLFLYAGAKTQITRKYKNSDNFPKTQIWKYQNSDFTTFLCTKSTSIEMFSQNVEKYHQN